MYINLIFYAYKVQIYWEYNINKTASQKERFDFVFAEIIYFLRNLNPFNLLVRNHISSVYSHTQVVSTVWKWIFKRGLNYKHEYTRKSLALPNKIKKITEKSGFIKEEVFRTKDR